jgi:hypothetical protein
MNAELHGQTAGALAVVLPRHMEMMRDAAFNPADIAVAVNP